MRAPIRPPGQARTDNSDVMMAATLPETREADDALAPVRSKVMRGLSVEFNATRERREGGIRVIEKATLSGLALVDRGAYHGTGVEARRRPPGRTARWR